MTSIGHACASKPSQLDRRSEQSSAEIEPAKVKPAKQLTGRKRRYTGEFIIAVDGIRTACSPDKVKDASYKKCLSQADMVDQTALGFGVLLADEWEIRRHMQKQSLRTLLKRVHKGKRTKDKLIQIEAKANNKRICSEDNNASMLDRRSEQIISIRSKEEAYVGSKTVSKSAHHSIDDQETDEVKVAQSP